MFPPAHHVRHTPVMRVSGEEVTPPAHHVRHAPVMRVSVDRQRVSGIPYHGISSRDEGITKEDLCIEAQERSKHFTLIIKSSLFEGIFIDATGVNCASLETVRVKKYFLELFLKFCSNINTSRFQNSLGITVVNKMLYAF